MTSPSQCTKHLKLGQRQIQPSLWESFPKMTYGFPLFAAAAAFAVFVTMLLLMSSTTVGPQRLSGVSNHRRRLPNINKLLKKKASSSSADNGVKSDLLKNGYVLLGQLGQGGFGTVHSASNLKGKIVAIKCLDVVAGLAEMRALNKIKTSMTSKYICNLQHAFLGSSDTKAYLVFERMDTCAEKFAKQNKKMKAARRNKNLRTILLGTAKGLAHIHSKGLIHRDIKAGNVLFNLDRQGNVKDVKVCDMGTVCRKNEVKDFYGTSEWYHAFEIKSAHEKGQKFTWTEKGDVFALGCLYVMLVHGNMWFRPFVRNPKGLKEIALKNGATPQEIELIQKLLVKDPQKRIGLNEFIRQFELLC